MQTVQSAHLNRQPATRYAPKNKMFRSLLLLPLDKSKTNLESLVSHCSNLLLKNVCPLNPQISSILINNLKSL